jgi:hypothetical protein
MRKISLLLAALPTLLMLGCDQKPKQTTDADAAALQAELHDWLAALVNPLLPADAQPVKVTPDGTGFRLRVESPASADQFVPHGTAMSLRATRGKEGVWQIDDYTIPSSLTIKLPAPAQPPPSQTVTPNVMPPPQDISFSIAHSAYRGTFDPSLKQPSHLEGAMEGFKEVVGAVEASIGKSTSTTDLLPNGKGQVDIKSHAAYDDMTERFALPNGVSGEVGWKHGESNSQVMALSPDQLRGVIQAVSSLIGAARQTPTTMPGKEQVLAIVEPLFALADSASMEADMTGFTLQVQAVSATAEHTRLAFTFGSEAGRPRLGYRIQVQNFDVPLLATGTWREFLPRNITLAFGLGGVPKERLHQFVLDSLDHAGNTGVLAQALRQQDGARLLTDGADVSVDELAFNLGATTLAGHARIHVMPAQQVSATVDIEAINLDSLMSKVSQEPTLAQAVPVLAMARGLAKSEGDKQVWHIEADNNNVVTVNGVDLRSLAPQRR